MSELKPKEPVRHEHWLFRPVLLPGVTVIELSLLVLLVVTVPNAMQAALRLSGQQLQDLFPYIVFVLIQPPLWAFRVYCLARVWSRNRQELYYYYYYLSFLILLVSGAVLAYQKGFWEHIMAVALIFVVFGVWEARREWRKALSEGAK